MSLIKNKNQDSYPDVTSLLISKYAVILEKLTELYELWQKLGTDKIDEEIYMKMVMLNSSIYTQLIKYFYTEEMHLLTEMYFVLPIPSCVSVIKEEHLKILNMCDSMQNLLFDKERLKQKMQEIESYIIGLGDLFQRTLNKKEKIVYNEAKSLLSPQLLDEIHNKVCIDLNETTNNILFVK